MSEKNSNEITLRIKVSKEEFVHFLVNHNFKEIEQFSLDDYYFIPKETKLDKKKVRQILAKAILIRNIQGGNTERILKLTFKQKEINENGEIVKQKATNCDIYHLEEAKSFLEAIGYYEIMNIKENDMLYEKDDLEIAVKCVDNGENLIEIETNNTYDTVDKLIDKIKELKLPVDISNYYVKKAEEYLESLI